MPYFKSFLQIPYPYISIHSDAWFGAFDSQRIDLNPDAGGMVAPEPEDQRAGFEEMWSVLFSFWNVTRFC